MRRPSPIASDHPRPRKSARTDEPQSSTSDTDKDTDTEEVPQAVKKKHWGRPKKRTDADPDPIDLTRLRSLLKARDALKDDDIDEVVGPAEPIFDDQWTQQDEGTMMLEWDSSPEKAAFAAIRPDNGAIRSLWKACLRIFRCTPLYLLSPLMNLRFQPLIPSNGLLPQKFCRRLAALVVHPTWRGDPERLAVALQYAVITRTDDRRRWNIPVRGATLGNLSANINKAKGPMMPTSIHEMLTAVRESDNSMLFDILYEIGEMMVHSNFRIPKAPVEDTVYRGHQVYLVTTRDLQVVSKAVDKVGWECMVPVERTYEAFKSLRGTTDMPRSEQLLDFHMRAGKQQLRLLAKAEAEARAMSDPEHESTVQHEPRIPQRRPPANGMEAISDNALFTDDDDNETPVVPRPLSFTNTEASEANLRRIASQISQEEEIQDRLRSFGRELAKELREAMESELAKRGEAIDELRDEIDGLRDRMLNPHRTHGGSDYGFATGKPADDRGGN